MKHLLILLIAASSICCQSAPKEGATLEITYIANEGFLIQSETEKVLIDALFHDPRINFCDVPPQDVLEKMEKAEAPFADIDLILVTHDHWDHFSAPSVARHLKSNPKSILVCPAPAADKLKRECPFSAEIRNRVREVSPALNESIALDVNRIRVQAHRMRHCQYMEIDEKTGKERDRHENVQNLVYLIEMGGKSLLHMGDATLELNREYVQSLGLEKQQVRVAFVEYFDCYEGSKEILDKDIKPDHIVFMHLPAEKDKKKKIADFLRQEFSETIVFEEPMASLKLD
ncbi:MAG: MBL fold metallo-hydrolase [Planctomycetota bacterium]|jgi:L-ascorbate metabolism protein UlaG (beta-lactamase superfamily)